MSAASSSASEERPIAGRGSAARPGDRRQPAAGPVRGRRVDDQPGRAGAGDARRRPRPPRRLGRVARRHDGGAGRGRRRGDPATSRHDAGCPDLAGPGVQPVDDVDLVPVHAVGGRVPPLLRADLERSPVAAVPRRDPTVGLRRDELGRLPRRQPALRRRASRRRSPRAARCGSTTTTCTSCPRWSARCGPTCGSASSCTSRSRRRSCSCGCRGATRSSAGCSARTSIGFQRRVAAENFVGPRASPRRLRNRRGRPRRSTSACRPTTGASCASARSRSRSTSTRSTRSRADRRARRACARSASGSAIPRRSCSASIDSTTRRASTSASPASPRCSSSAGHEQRRRRSADAVRRSCSSRSRCPVARASRTTSTSGARSSSSSAR